MLRREPEPTAEMLDTGPATHVGPNLREDRQRRALFDPLDGRQVDPCQTIEGRAGVKTRFIGFLMTAGLRGERLAVTFIRKGVEMRLELLIAHGQLLLVEVIQFDGLL